MRTRITLAWLTWKRRFGNRLRRLSKSTPRSTMKSASIYRRAGAYFVNPLAGSQGGDPCLFSEPVTKLDQEVAAEMLGAAVSAALQLSRHDAPWPKDWKGFSDALYAAAGVRSEAAFRQGALHVRVDLTGSALTITPSTSKGPHKGGAPIMDKIITTELTDAQSLGGAVIRALAISD